MTNPFVNNGLSLTTPLNMFGASATARILPGSQPINQYYHPQTLMSTGNPATFDLSTVKPLLPTLPQVASHTALGLGKERDNTWLQLPVCPLLYRHYHEGQADIAEGNIDGCADGSQLPQQVTCDDSKCHSGFAHPPLNVMKYVLTSGYVVCCQSYIFATKNGATAQNSGCVRGETKCR